MVVQPFHSPPFFLCIPEITLGFNSVVYGTSENSRFTILSLCVVSGNSGEFSLTLVVNTDDDNTETTATGSLIKSVHAITTHACIMLLVQ